MTRYLFTEKSPRRDFFPRFPGLLFGNVPTENVFDGVQVSITVQVVRQKIAAFRPLVPTVYRDELYPEFVGEVLGGAVRKWLYGVFGIEV